MLSSLLKLTSSGDSSECQCHGVKISYCPNAHGGSCHHQFFQQQAAQQQQQTHQTAFLLPHSIQALQNFSLQQQQHLQMPSNLHLYHLSSSPKNQFGPTYSISPISSYDSCGSLTKSIAQQFNVRRLYKIEKLIGEGSFGAVLLAVQRSTNQQVAIKVIRKSQIRDMSMDAFVQREIQILKRVKHDNIARFIDYIDTQDYVCLVLEHAPIQSMGLNCIWNEHATVTEEQGKKYCLELMSALEYLQDVHHIVHRDLQLDNVCLSKDDHVKIIDFGCADFYTPGVPSHNLYCGNSHYAAPEMLLKQTYVGPETDVWTLGVLMFRILTGYTPFLNATKMMNREFRIDLNEEPLSSQCKQFLNDILIVDPKKRPTLKQLKNHPWFSS